MTKTYALGIPIEVMPDEEREDLFRAAYLAWDREDNPANYNLEIEQLTLTTITARHWLLESHHDDSLWLIDINMYMQSGIGYYMTVYLPYVVGPTWYSVVRTPERELIFDKRHRYPYHKEEK